MDDGKDEPTAGPQDARYASQCRSKVGNVHQGHKADDAIKHVVCNTVKGSGVGLEILDPARIGLLMTARDRQQFRRYIDTDDTCTQIRQMSRHPALATGEVADMPPGHLTHERADGGKVWILVHRM